MAITKNKIATRRACNNISTVVNAGFSGELDQCPTKSEINATKKIIVLESGVRSNDRNLTANYSDNQCIKEEDIGHYVKLDYEYDLPGSARVNFHKDRVNTSNFDASVTEYFTAFTNSMSTGNGTNEVALTPSFFEQEWGSDLEITVSYGSSTSDVQQMFINSYPGTKSSDGTYFKWNNGNSSLIMSGLANRTMKLVVTETAADVITYGIVMSPTTISNMTQGSTKQLTVKYYKYVNGLADQTSVVDVTSQCSYEVSNTAVTVSSSGLVTAGNKGGSAVITAKYNGYTDTTSVNVNYAITYGIVMTPSTISNMEQGGTSQLTVNYCTYYDGVLNSSLSQDVTSKCSYSSSTTAVTVSSSGLVTAGNKGGNATITATYSGYTDTTTVSVKKRVTYGLVMTPESITNMAQGSTQQLTVKYCTYYDGVLDTASALNVTTICDYTISDSSVATVSKGVVTAGNKGGSATITASYDGYTDTTSVSVNTVGTFELVMTPSTISNMTPGSTQQLTVMYNVYTDNVLSSSTDVTSQCNYSVSTTAVTVSLSGLVTAGNKGGSATITATYPKNSPSLTATTSVSVQSVTTYEFIVEPTTLNILCGETGTIAAKFNTKTDGVDSWQTVTDKCNWKTSNSNIAISMGNGEVLGGNTTGTTTITATYPKTNPSYTATTEVTNSYAEKVLTGITTSPSSVSQPAGMTSDIKVYAHYNNGSQADVTSMATVTIPGDHGKLIGSYSNGVITHGISVTSTTWTVSYSEPNSRVFEIPLVVTNQEPIPIAITVNPSAITMNINSVASFEAAAMLSDGLSIPPSGLTYTTDATQGNLTVAVDGNEVKVTSGGKIATHTITVSCNYGGVEIYTTVSVTIQPEVITLTSIEFDELGYTMGQGGYSYPKVFANYSNGKNKEVTSSCTFTITDSSTNGVCSWNNTTKALGHQFIGTAKLNASYTEGGVTQRTTANVETTETYPLSITITPSTVNVPVGTTYSDFVISAPLNNGNTTNAIRAFKFTSTDPSIVTATKSGDTLTLKGIKEGVAQIEVQYANGYGPITQIGVSVLNEFSWITITPDPCNVYVGGTPKTLTATFYTSTNGVTGEGINVTSNCTWTTDNSEIVSGRNGGSISNGVIYPGSTLGTTNVNASYTFGDTICGDRVTVTNKEEPIITMTVNNLQQIVSAEHGEDGVDDVIVFVDDSGNRINVGLAYDLYYFEGDCDNTVSGPVSAWQELYYNYSHVYLGDYDDKGIISEDLEDGQWDTIYEFITSAKEDCEDKSFSIDWPMRTSPTTTYELEVTPNSSTIEIGESTQFTATYWTLEKGERTTSIDVTSDATWTSSDSTLATVDKGYVTGINQGVDIEITATYNTVSDTSWVEVAEPETVSIPVTFSAENWGNLGQECDIMISARLYNYKTQQSQPICSNKHIVVGDAGNGRPAYYETLATVQINPDEKSDWNLQLWGYPNTCTSGVFSVNLMSPLGDRYYQIIQDIDTDTDWQTADSYPYEGSLSNYYEGDSIDIYFRGDY